MGFYLVESGLKFNRNDIRRKERDLYFKATFEKGKPASEREQGRLSLSSYHHQRNIKGTSPSRIA